MRLADTSYGHATQQRNGSIEPPVKTVSCSATRSFSHAYVANLFQVTSLRLTGFKDDIMRIASILSICFFLCVNVSIYIYFCLCPPANTSLYLLKSCMFVRPVDFVPFLHIKFAHKNDTAQIVNNKCKLYNIKYSHKNFVCCCFMILSRIMTASI